MAIPLNDFGQYIITFNTVPTICTPLYLAYTQAIITVCPFHPAGLQLLITQMKPHRTSKLHVSHHQTGAHTGHPYKNKMSFSLLPRGKVG